MDGASQSPHKDRNEHLCFSHGKTWCARFRSFLCCLCSIQRLKMRFLLKANELPLWAHFLLFSPTLYSPRSHSCSFKSAFQLVRVQTPFLHTCSLFSFPRQHLIHPAPLWGAARTIKGFVGELSPSEGCSKPDQPPLEPQLASGTKYSERERERELRPWQSGEKTEGETDTERRGSEIDLDKTAKACCTAREKQQI